MSDFPTRQEPGSLAPVEPLTSKTADGKPYERPASVQAEISRTIPLDSPELLRQSPDLKNETLAYFIKRGRDRDREFIGRLMQVIGKRIHRLARSRLRPFDKETAKEMILAVEHQIFILLLEPKPSLANEFLEVAFAEDVIKRTFMAIRKHLRTPLGHRGEVFPGSTDEDGDEIERPIELVQDNRSGPEAACLQNEEEAAKAKELQQVRDAVDPLQFDALMFHFGEGKPIRSSDLNEIDLMRHLGVSEGRARYLLRAGKKAIRKALGGKEDDEK